MPDTLSTNAADSIERLQRLVQAWDEPVRAVQELVNDLGQLAPDVIERARTAVRHDDSLLRDDEHGVVAVLRGGACLLYDGPKLLQIVRDQMNLAWELILPAETNPESLAALNRLREKIKTELTAAARLALAGRKFCEPENLRGLAKWASLDAAQGQRHRMRQTETGLGYVIETGKDAAGNWGWWEIAIPGPEVFAEAAGSL